eukprot:gene22020-biopygen7732
MPCSLSTLSVCPDLFLTYRAVMDEQLLLTSIDLDESESPSGKPLGHVTLSFMDLGHEKLEMPVWQLKYCPHKDWLAKTGHPTNEKFGWGVVGLSAGGGSEPDLGFKRLRLVGMMCI